MNYIDEVDVIVDYIREHPKVETVEWQSTTPLYGGRQVVLLRVYMDEPNPPDLGVHVGDGLGVKLERRD